MKTMVRQIRRRYGAWSAHEALVSMMWAGLLRPREAVTTPPYPRYDITCHPSRQEVSFFSASGAEIQPGQGVPSRMEFGVKYSKTGQRRMAATIVMVGPTGDPDFCPMSAMRGYLGSRCSRTIRNHCHAACTLCSRETACNWCSQSLRACTRKFCSRQRAPEPAPSAAAREPQSLHHLQPPESPRACIICNRQ